MGKKDLSNMGSAHVSIETFAGEPCIVKKGASDVEMAFYQFAAGALAGVNTPKLRHASGNHLVIEYIPHRITLDGLHANTSTFEQLACIHHSTYQPHFPITTHSWNAGSTDSAMQVLNLPQVTQDSIRTIEQLSCELFNDNVLISGDTNEGNWGVRDNGELVLFDWERFGVGSPAIDLAPLVRGLGSVSEYECIIERYARYSGSFSQDKLLRQLILAKVWLIVDVTNILARRAKSSASIYFDWYRTHVPHWLMSVEKRI